MGRIAPVNQISSAYVVLFGRYGDVSRYAQQRNVSRQRVYREAHRLHDRLHDQEHRCQQLQQELQQLRCEREHLQKQLDHAVVVDDEKQSEFASVAQALGVSLPNCRELLEVLIPGRSLSVASLGRRTQKAGVQAGKLLAVLDESMQERVRELAADEIYVKDPVLMGVEPQSLCWVSGRLAGDVSGESWSKEFRSLSNLEQVTRDGGSGLAKGVEIVNAERQAKGRPPVVDQGDHFHALQRGGVGLRRVQQQAAQALAKAEKAEKAMAECRRQGRSQAGHATQAQKAWQEAEQEMDRWCEQERAWRQSQKALRLFTPEGHLNTRSQAEAVLAETLPQLPDKDFAKTKRQLQKPEMLNYLDRVQDKLQALDADEHLKRAAIRQEGLRRHPELMRGQTTEAAARRGVMLVCAMLLSQSGTAGDQVIASVCDIFRRAYRASSIVECINSVLRMQQARHRKMTQGLLDLKRLYWNSHTFRTGRRRNTTPYERLKVPWPEGMRWWQVLKLTPEQLRDKLSAAKMAV